MAIGKKYNIYLSDELKEMIERDENVGRYFEEGLTIWLSSP